MNHESRTGFQFFTNTGQDRAGMAVYDPAIPGVESASWTRGIQWTGRPGPQTPYAAPLRDHEQDIAIADVVFKAWGATQEELFSACADAVTNVLIGDLTAIEPRERCMLSLAGEARDILLLSLLSELIVLQKTRGRFLKITSLAITGSEGAFHLKAAAAGEKFNRARHGSRAGVKAIALHRLSVTQQNDRWIASVAFDILSA